MIWYSSAASIALFLVALEKQACQRLEGSRSLPGGGSLVLRDAMNMMLLEHSVWIVADSSTLKDAQKAMYACMCSPKIGFGFKTCNKGLGNCWYSPCVVYLRPMVSGFFPTPHCSLVFMCFISSIIYIFLSSVLYHCQFLPKKKIRFQDGYSRRIWTTICLLVVIYIVIVYFHVSDGTNPWMKKTPQNSMEYLPPTLSN